MNTVTLPAKPLSANDLRLIACLRDLAECPAEDRQGATAMLLDHLAETNDPRWEEIDEGLKVSGAVDDIGPVFIEWCNDCWGKGNTSFRKLMESSFASSRLGVPCHHCQSHGFFLKPVTVKCKACKPRFLAARNYANPLKCQKCGGHGRHTLTELSNAEAFEKVKAILGPLAEYDAYAMRHPRGQTALMEYQVGCSVFGTHGVTWEEALERLASIKNKRDWESTL